ncbi:MULTISPECIES: hypothetical protein [unclassified Neisseria]|uniref:hypothetical protein n=1 Tax=unclassified Neisseria TaxID=2623750 RepID=UPI001071DB15|nr:MULTISPECIES: hypothetical protein [unclassified Neisseria]MBF0804422.1 hypothetical protein [Neisseria sp. 19428wB4_WF04]TFU42793.1 hypothetical protein E4T99_08730 [Neisseria sp. WF04]
MNTAYYLHCFASLNCARHKGKEAPHKPVLLLALADLAEQGRLKGTETAPDAALETAFRQVWRRYVADVGFTMNMGMPFYHMRSEPFWHLSIGRWSGGDIEDRHKIKNLGTLRRVAARATINAGLIDCLNSITEWEKLRALLIERYFNRRNGGTDRHGPGRQDVPSTVSNLPSPQNGPQYCAAA